MWKSSVVQNNTSIIPDQRRRIHRIDQSRGSSVRCPNKSVSVLSPQSQIVPTVQKWETGWAVLGLAACHTNWKMEQVRRADQALYPMQWGSFVGRGPWLHATSPCWNHKAEKEATVEVLLLLRSSTHTCSELPSRIVLWNASYMQKHFHYTWQEWVSEETRKAQEATITPAQFPKLKLRVENAQIAKTIPEPKIVGEGFSARPRAMTIEAKWINHCRYVKGTSPFDITVTSGHLRWHRNQGDTCALCWNQKAEKEATVEVLLLFRSSTHTHLLNIVMHNIKHHMQHHHTHLCHKQHS